MNLIDWPPPTFGLLCFEFLIELVVIWNYIHWWGTSILWTQYSPPLKNTLWRHMQFRLQAVCVYGHRALWVCVTSHYQTVLDRYLFAVDPSYMESIQEKYLRAVSVCGLGAGEGFVNLPEQCKGTAKPSPAAPLLGEFPWKHGKIDSVPQLCHPGTGQSTPFQGLWHIVPLDMWTKVWR